LIAMPDFTHFDDSGATRMVNVGDKSETQRKAVASGLITMLPETWEKIRLRQFKKGDVLEVARLAGIMATKRTADLIPLCHPLALTSVELELIPVRDPVPGILIRATVGVFGRTGVEMEALTAVSVAALTVYDMCKSVDRGMTIQQIQLEAKSGGQSGDFLRSDDSPGS
jgi:cyclic pyranopterin monophosphate synthase